MWSDGRGGEGETDDPTNSDWQGSPEHRDLSLQLGQFVASFTSSLFLFDIQFSQDEETIIRFLSRNKCTNVSLKFLLTSLIGNFLHPEKHS